MIKTKQELLNHFTDINAMYNNPFMYQTLSNMIDELLEQQPCGDCISRTELLARIDAERKHLLDIKMDGAEHIVVHHARRIIEDMPSITPQPKTGHWIDIETLDSALWHECSECGETEFYATNYCPNCGVRMIEVRESEE